MNLNILNTQEQGASLLRLFSLVAKAQRKKKQKRNAAFRGAAPYPARFFEKSGAKTFLHGAVQTFGAEYYYRYTIFIMILLIQYQLFLLPRK